MWRLRYSLMRMVNGDRANSELNVLSKIKLKQVSDYCIGLMFIICAPLTYMAIHRQHYRSVDTVDVAVFHWYSFLVFFLVGKFSEEEQKVNPGNWHISLEISILVGETIDRKFVAIQSHSSNSDGDVWALARPNWITTLNWIYSKSSMNQTICNWNCFLSLFRRFHLVWSSNFVKEGDSILLW